VSESLPALKKKEEGEELTEKEENSIDKAIEIVEEYSGKSYTEEEFNSEQANACIEEAEERIAEIQDLPAVNEEENDNINMASSQNNDENVNNDDENDNNKKRSFEEDSSVSDEYVAKKVKRDDDDDDDNSSGGCALGNYSTNDVSQGDITNEGNGTNLAIIISEIISFVLGLIMAIISTYYGFNIDMEYFSNSVSVFSDSPEP
jgi:hypothetical protein